MAWRHIPGWSARHDELSRCPALPERRLAILDQDGRRILLARVRLPHEHGDGRGDRSCLKVAISRVGNLTALVPMREETAFDEHCDGRNILADDVETAMLDSPIMRSCCPNEGILNETGQRLACGGIIEGFNTVGARPRSPVVVQADKERLLEIGRIAGPPGQRQGDIAIARQSSVDTHVVEVVFHGQSQPEIDVFLRHLSIHGSGLFASVPWIEDDGGEFLSVGRAQGSQCGGQDEGERERARGLTL